MKILRKRKFNFFWTKIYVAWGLGIVSKCTLNVPSKCTFMELNYHGPSKCSLTGKINNINVEGRSYCAVDHGKRRHPEAVEWCKKLNARLPLPRTKAELDEFRKVSPSWTHVDGRNPKKSSNKTEWIDAEGKPHGSRPVYLWDHNYLFLDFISLPVYENFLWAFLRTIVYCQ